MKKIRIDFEIMQRHEADITIEVPDDFDEDELEPMFEKCDKQSRYIDARDIVMSSYKVVDETLESWTDDEVEVDCFETVED